MQGEKKRSVALLCFDRPPSQLLSLVSNSLWSSQPAELGWIQLSRYRECVTITVEVWNNTFGIYFAMVFIQAHCA